MTNYYIHNKETGKIELHFDKDDYLALTNDQKRAIKSNFLFSRGTGAWVSRCKYPNLYRPIKVAEALGLVNEGEIGERLTFAEQQERKEERAERRAERYDAKAEKAMERGENLQKPINDMHGDIAFFTQPNINTSAGRAFTNRRNRMFAAWERGFDEFKKSEYYAECAEKARRTASGKDRHDKAFCQRRIDEAEASIRGFNREIAEQNEYKACIERGETPKNKYGWEVETTIEHCNNAIERYYDLLEFEIEKVVYYKECIEQLGGIAFNKDNINKGDILRIKHWYGIQTVKVVNKGKKNITFIDVEKSGNGGQCPYSEIIEFVAKGDPDKEEKHPFKVGESFTCPVWDRKERLFKNKTFIIIKATDKSVTLQTGEDKPFTRKPSLNLYNRQWMVKIGDGYRGTWYKGGETA